MDHGVEKDTIYIYKGIYKKDSCLVVKNALETFSEGKLLRLSAMQKVGQRIYRNGQNHKDHVKNKESFKHDCIRKYKR